MDYYLRYIQKLNQLAKQTIIVFICIKKDIVSHTGSGKTLAYMLPIVNSMKIAE